MEIFSNLSTERCFARKAISNWPMKPKFLSFPMILRQYIVEIKISDRWGRRAAYVDVKQGSLFVNIWKFS